MDCFFTPQDPLNPQGPILEDQGPWKPRGGLWGNPYNIEPGGHTCKDTINMLMYRETWMNLH
jgi:hypothetical protein